MNEALFGISQPAPPSAAAVPQPRPRTSEGRDTPPHAYPR